MKTYQELVQEIKEDLANGAKRTFSKEAFVDLSRAYLNDVDNKVTTVKTKNGELEESEVEVVKNFRKMIQRILLDFGIDKQESEKIMTNDYQFQNVDALYEVCSELIYNYVDAGKKFTFIPKHDCVASLVLDEFEEETKYNKNPKDPQAEPRATLYKKHKKIKCECTTPSWLKELVDDKADGE